VKKPFDDDPDFALLEVRSLAQMSTGSDYELDYRAVLDSALFKWRARASNPAEQERRKRVVFVYAYTTMKVETYSAVCTLFKAITGESMGGN